MKTKTIEEIQEEYDLELDKIIKEINKIDSHKIRSASSKSQSRAKIVLLQFPDGLKQYATTIVDYLEQKTNKVEFIIWLGSCYGACDVPVGLDGLKPKIDLTVQFGHNEMMPGY